jgi:hypothetical protein
MQAHAQRLLFPLLIAFSFIGFAAAQTKSQLASEILDAADDKKSAAYQEARKKYDEAAAAGTADVRVQYAMALVSLQHNRLPVAEELLTSLRSSPKPMLPIRKAALWTHLSRKNFKEVDAAVAEIAAHLPVDDAAVTADHEALADMLGAAAGFLADLPDDTQAKERAATVEAISAVRLAPKLQARYRDAQALQVKRHADLRGQADALRPGLAEKAKEKFQKIIDNANERQPIAEANARKWFDDANSLDSRADSLEDQAKDERKEAKRDHDRNDRGDKKGKKSSPDYSTAKQLEQQASAVRALAKAANTKAKTFQLSSVGMIKSRDEAQQSLFEIENGRFDFPGITNLERTRQSWTAAYPLDLAAERQRLQATLR